MTKKIFKLEMEIMSLFISKE